MNIGNKKYCKKPDTGKCNREFSEGEKESFQGIIFVHGRPPHVKIHALCPTSAHEEYTTKNFCCPFGGKTVK